MGATLIPQHLPLVLVPEFPFCASGPPVGTNPGKIESGEAAAYVSLSMVPSRVQRSNTILACPRYSKKGRTGSLRCGVVFGFVPEGAHFGTGCQQNIKRAVGCHASILEDHDLIRLEQHRATM